MNYPNLTTQNPVRDFVNQNPDISVKLFGELQIDYCCGGAKSLAQHCDAKQLDPNHVLDRLNSAPPVNEEKIPIDWKGLDAAKLIDHIVTTHHKYLEDVFPELIALTKKVAQAHGKNHPEFIELEKAVHFFAEDLKQHMKKEEEILFPMIKAMEETLMEETVHCGTVENPIRVMLAEHENAGRLLQRIRSLTHDYSAPKGTCETVKHLFRMLKNVEEDTHLHVHKENNRLFPLILEPVDES